MGENMCLNKNNFILHTKRKIIYIEKQFYIEKSSSYFKRI